jgi:hypothetical protein
MIENHRKLIGVGVQWPCENRRWLDAFNHVFRYRMGSGIAKNQRDHHVEFGGTAEGQLCASD